jgi:hypothetical protein
MLRPTLERGADGALAAGLSHRRREWSRSADLDQPPRSLGGLGAPLVRKRWFDRQSHLFWRNGNISALRRVYRHMSLEMTKEYRRAHVGGALGLMAVRTGELNGLLGASTLAFRRGIKELAIIDISLTLQGVAHD